MKIVQLCPYAMSRPGGVQRHVRDLSVWLTRQGHQVRIIAPPAPGQVPQRDELLTELGHARAFGTHGTAYELSFAGPMARRRVLADLRNWGAELVHLHTPWTPMLVGQMWRGLRLPPCLPTLTTIHATLPQLAGKGLIDRYIRRSARYFLSQSDGVVVPSSAPLPMLDRLIPDITASILPPAVDLTQWRAAAQPRENGPLSVVFLGRLEPRKGVDLLLKAWPSVSASLPDATLTIAGDGALRDRVQAAAGRNLIYAGRPGDAAARALLGGADIFVAPAPYGESYGLVLAEAMSAGAVPLAAANAGYASVLGADAPDLLVEPGNVDALAQGLIALASDPERLTAARRWAFARALESDLARAGPGYETIYAQTLAKARINRAR